MLPHVVSKRKGIKKIAKRLKEACKSKTEKKLSEVIILTQSFLCECYGILGFPKFTDGHYIYMITKKEKIGEFLGSDIFQVREAKLEMILNQVSFRQFLHFLKLF